MKSCTKASFFLVALAVGASALSVLSPRDLPQSPVARILVDGELVEYTLGPGQQMVVDTGNVLGFEGGVSIDIQQVKGLKNKLLGGEGFFNTVLTGPGKIWLQTMPISGVASALIPYIPTGGNN